MPNWCECEVKINGETTMVEKLLKEVKDGDKSVFSLNKIIPRPDGIENWYAWGIAIWGTKWDTEDTRIGGKTIKGNKTTTYIDFMTAWSPPIPAIRTLSTKYPDANITMKYWESGMGFCGSITVKNGITIKESYRNNYNGRRGG